MATSSRRLMKRSTAAQRGQRRAAPSGARCSMTVAGLQDGALGQRPGMFPEQRCPRKLIAVDRAEALAVAQAELVELRQATYSQLVERLLDKQENVERLGASGTRYKI